MDSLTQSILLELLNFSSRKNQKLYVVGGTLRDFLSRKPCTDFDLTGESAAELGNSFAQSLNFTSIHLDNTPGRETVRVILNPNQHLDFTDLQGKNIEEDLSQRDFTINAMGQLLSGFLSGSTNIIDPFKGQEDLQNRNIHVLEGPIFQSDPIRILRAFRFAATLGFEIEKETLKKIAHHKDIVLKPAQERIWHELALFFKAPCALPVLETMHNCGVMGCLFPTSNNEVQILNHYRNQESLLIEPEKTFPDFVDAFKESTFINNQFLLKLSVLLQGLEQKTEFTSLPDEWNHRASNAEIKFMVQSIKGARHLAGIDSGHALNPSEMYELTQTIHNELLASVVLFTSGNPLSKVVQLSNNILKFYYHQFLPAINERPLLNGEDLIHQLNLSPSPLFGKILNHVQKEQVLGNITTHAEALKLARELIQSPLTESKE